MLLFVFKYTFFVLVTFFSFKLEEKIKNEIKIDFNAFIFLLLLLINKGSKINIFNIFYAEISKNILKIDHRITILLLIKINFGKHNVISKRLCFSKKSTLYNQNFP